MIRAVRSEWVKQLRLRFLAGWAGVMVALPLVLTWVLFANAESAGGEEAAGGPPPGAVPTVRALSQPEGLIAGVEQAAGFLGVVALALVAVRVAMEYSHGTWRVLLVTEPGRLRLLGGKLIGLASLLALVTALTTAASIAVAFLVAPEAVDTAAWTTGEAGSVVAATYLNVTGATITYGLLGAALAMITRSAAAAIAIGVGWLLVLEQIVGGIWAFTREWLPGTALAAFAQGGQAGQAGMGYATAAAIVAAAAALSVVVTTAVFVRRDVTS